MARPRLRFLISKNQKRIDLTVPQDGSSNLSLFDENANVRLALNVKASGATYIAGVGSKGQPAFELSTLADDTVQEFFFDQKGQVRLRFLTRPGGRTEASLLGPGGKAGLWMQVAENGDAMQALFDQNGTDRIRTSLNSNGPSMSFFDAGHHRRWISGVTSDGRSVQEFYDGNGRCRIAFAVFPEEKAEEAFLRRTETCDSACSLEKVRPLRSAVFMMRVSSNQNVIHYRRAS